MNDNKAILSNGIRTREKCQLPGCGKQVLYIGRHLKNIHKMDVSSYRAKIKSKAGERFAEIDVNKSFICHLEPPSKKAKVYSVNDSVTCIPESPESSTRSELNAHKKGTVNAHVKKLFEDDLPAMTLPSDNEKGIDLRENNRNEDAEKFKFSFERFCFIKHQVTPYGVLALCAFLKKKSLSEFFMSKLCRDIFSPLTWSELTDIYNYRQYLNGYFRFVKYLIYRLDHDVIKNHISSCLACGANVAGHCTCPIPSKTFYLKVKKFKCADETDCRICKRTNKSVDHDCLDFFTCKTCGNYCNTRKVLTEYTYGV